MKNNFVSLFLIALITAGIACASASAQDVIAFVDVTVVPMDAERMVAGQTVLVEGDRITAVGADVNVPDGAMVVDGSGKYLMPGLAEMHGHIPPPNQPPEYIESVLFMYVANGITTVRGMLGHDGQLALRDQVNRNELIGPNMYLAGPSFSGGSVHSPEQAAAKVRQQVQEGWDLLKVHPGLSVEEFDAMANTANRLGIRFGGHIPAEVGLKHALEMGQETMDHIDGYIAYMGGEETPVTDAQIADAIELTKEHGGWIVPTMVLWETLYGVTTMEIAMSMPGLDYMPPQVLNQWRGFVNNRLNNPDVNPETDAIRIDNRNRLLRAMNEGGVRILMGTDAPQIFSVPGFSIHPELARMADAGMTPYEILKTGTWNIGEYFANEDDFGTVASGQRADLILLNSNPLEDVAHIADRAGVMVRGNWLSEAMIQEKLDEIKGMYTDVN